ncbi:hypothetical protein [Nocardioides hwasunensis]|uniref:Htaa domain-containing protein n=1 Tax=Nocardioides hwasunensis TaxID=397258 RepID=A0ABR8MJE3_9ACTN|nr:hypothetical protein [Nocardioides hwasunensis]MBD3914209.1 hypothetical protein [Nocardioides hwasunensis]
MLTRTAAALASAALTLTATVVVAAPAHAAARVGVTNDQGTAMADDGRATSFTLRGSGFQSVKGGFGGVYVAFGWVRDPAAGGWRPSEGGVTGRDYRYVPDSESEDNAGYLRFVAFPGSSTAGEAQAVMSADGSFSVDLTVPGPTFQALDRNGDPVEVDCRKVTCGVITFGAHGVKNARNETFTPVRFGQVYADEAAAPTEEEPGPSAGTDEGSGTSESPRGGTSSGRPSAGDTGGETTAPVRRGRPKVSAERATAVAGQALAFTGSGFTPGEQVLALLDDGVVALGPLVAGGSGEVAGVMALPADLASGTHQLRLVGAASDARPSERFPVRAADPVALAPEPVATDEPAVAALAFVAASALALLASVVLLALRLRRRGRRTPVAGAPAGAIA